MGKTWRQTITPAVELDAFSNSDINCAVGLIHSDIVRHTVV